jgi:alpha-D-ribose 1-methylphosphonate 5-triphosphate synthase subunit PhnG
MSHEEALNTFAHVSTEAVAAFADTVLAEIGDVAVQDARTGLLLLPVVDNRDGVQFVLGEVLVSRATLRFLDHGVDGHGTCVGRDVRKAVALAVLDGALAAGVAAPRILEFAAAQRAQWGESDAVLRRRVAATRVEVETL